MCSSRSQTRNNRHPGIRYSFDVHWVLKCQLVSWLGTFKGWVVRRYEGHKKGMFDTRLTVWWGRSNLSIRMMLKLLIQNLKFMPRHRFTDMSVSKQAGISFKSICYADPCRVAVSRVISFKPRRQVSQAVYPNGYARLAFHLCRCRSPRKYRLTSQRAARRREFPCTRFSPICWLNLVCMSVRLITCTRLSGTNCHYVEHHNRGKAMCGETLSPRNISFGTIGGRKSRFGKLCSKHYPTWIVLFTSEGGRCGLDPNANFYQNL